MAYDFIISIKWQIDSYYLSKLVSEKERLINSLMIEVSFLINGMIGVLMSFFIKFHIYLVKTNKTTIENLEKKGQEYTSLYDVGEFHNWF